MPSAFYNFNLKGQTKVEYEKYVLKRPFQQVT